MVALTKLREKCPTITNEELSDVEALEVNETTASWVTKDPLLVPSFSNITVWSTGQGGTDSAATVVKVKGKFDDDTGHQR